MATTVKVQYAKTHLSALLTRVEQGEEIVIARGETPVARLSPLSTQSTRDLGFVAYDVPVEFHEELPESELAAWQQ